MSNEIVNNPTREDFITWINTRLSELGFVRETENELWKITRDVKSPGRTIIINGQRQDEPEQTTHIEYCVNVFGDGGVADENGENLKPFVEIEFYIINDEQKHMDWPVFCMYFDDQYLFNSLLNKIFRI